MSIKEAKVKIGCETKPLYQTVFNLLQLASDILIRDINRRNENHYEVMQAAQEWRYRWGCCHQDGDVPAGQAGWWCGISTDQHHHH